LNIGAAKQTSSLEARRAGNGGQHIRIVPSLDMVTVTTAGLCNQSASNLVYEMLEEEVNGPRHIEAMNRRLPFALK
jgi:hypothetical protein